MHDTVSERRKHRPQTRASTATRASAPATPAARAQEESVRSRFDPASTMAVGAFLLLIGAFALELLAPRKAQPCSAVLDAPEERSGVHVNGACVAARPVTVGQVEQHAPWSEWHYTVEGQAALLKEWERFRCEPSSRAGDKNISCLSAHRAAAFCRALEGRLPTEKEAVAVSSRGPHSEWVVLDSGKVGVLAPDAQTARPQPAMTRSAAVTFRCVRDEKSGR